MKLLEWAQIQYHQCPYTKKKFGHRDMCLQEEYHENMKIAIYKSKREA